MEAHTSSYSRPKQEQQPDPSCYEFPHGKKMTHRLKNQSSKLGGGKKSKAHGGMEQPESICTGSERERSEPGTPSGDGHLTTKSGS
jgi:hypothetical protein